MHYILQLLSSVVPPVKTMNKRANVPTEERLDRMLANDVPLSIYAKVKGQWQLVDYLFTVGPLADRDFVIPIDLTDITGEFLELKIETGFETGPFR